MGEALLRPEDGEALVGLAPSAPRMGVVSGDGEPEVLLARTGAGADWGLSSPLHTPRVRATQWRQLSVRALPCWQRSAKP
jgi:hypothetical protein